MDQKKQTLQYFDTHAGDWHSRSVGIDDRYNVIAARNAAVTKTIDRMSPVHRFLDIGCGTGQLVIDVAERGIKAKGIDFAPDMVRVCEINRKSAGVEAEFSCVSFFDLGDEAGAYDVVSAQGFIEYISPAETDIFLAKCASLLRPGGSLVVGSRNRLFNLMSLNDYTLAELRLGTLEQLAVEAIALQQSASWEDAVEALRAHEKAYAQPERHPLTGVKVEVRYQYSPADLIRRGRAFALTPRNIFPVHFHGLPVSVKQEHPQLHAELTNIVTHTTDDFRLVPYCSTFVLDLRKAE
jgi:2-polyprenyl-3-methyl-5-hydroxy-6-metoxy-1,4-benzoquinol methylase